MTLSLTGRFPRPETALAAPPTPADDNPATLNDDQLSFAFVTETVPMPARIEEESATQAQSIMEDIAADCAKPISEASDMRIADAPESLGARLRAGRQARGFSAEDVATQLRLPLAVVQAIEADTFERIPHQVYLRGYLQCYLRLLNLPQALAEPVLTQHAMQVPRLVTTGTISHSRYLYQRYSVPAVYLILTAVIVVPTVWLAFRGGLDQNLSRWAPLDTSQPSDFKRNAIQQSGNVSDAGVNTAETSAIQSVEGRTAEVVLPNVAAKDDAPLLASMASFSTSSAETPNQAADIESTKSLDFQAVHTVRLSFTEASWVEIFDSDGKRLEYGMLAAGSAHEFHSSKPLLIRIGNANGAALEADGKALDITPYRHANVAHFKLFGDKATLSHTDY